MKALDIDFAPPPRLSPWWWLLPLALACVAAWVALGGWNAWSELQQLRATNERLRLELRERMQVVASTGSDGQPPPAYAADALWVAAMASFPLQGVLAALESVSVPTVELGSVEVDTAAARVRIEVQFGVYAELLKYVDQLNAGEPVPRWWLVQARAAAAAGSPTGTATIESRWSGTAFLERGGR
jgi:hypothetical protein